MKKTLSLFICLFLVFSMTPPVSALDTGKVIYRSEEVLDNGFIVISKIIDHSQARSTTKSYEHTKAYTKNGATVAVFSIYGSFQYDGSNVSVLSKSVTRTDTYNGWSYAQNAFTSSGGTISLSGKLTKLLNSSIAISMTLSCDASGNISYTWQNCHRKNGGNFPISEFPAVHFSLPNKHPLAVRYRKRALLERSV